MCLLCKYKKTSIPTVDLESVAQIEVDRSRGLSNVYNIGNEVSFVDEVFLEPLYTLSGATIPNSGFTTTNCSGVTTASTYTTSGCTAVYNLSEVDEIDLVFQITGNTEYTGYTGSFCYHTFNLNRIPKDRVYVTKKDAVYSKCFEYSAITANTIYDTINSFSIDKGDYEYIIKDYNIFTTKNFLDNLEVNSFDLTTYPKEDLFNDGWYFVTTVNPEKPIVSKTRAFDITQDTILVTETPNLIEGQTTIFKIGGYALNNKFIVFVNGILLTENLDWIYRPDLGNGYFELISGTLEPTKDVIQVSYLKNISVDVDIINLNETGLIVDAGIVNSITTGITSGVTNLTVNYNPIKSRQEILLTYPNRSGSGLIFVVNGIKLKENVEYFISTSDSRKLIMNPSNEIKIGDALSIFYITDQSLLYYDLGYFRTLTPTVYWSAPDSYSNYRSEDGKFLLQVTTGDDTEFLNPIQSKFYDFYNPLGQINVSAVTETYSATLDQLPTNVGENFLFRVSFFKDYHILFNNTITTRAVSDIVAFRVNIAYAQNSY
jgi:hypothetical protein